jgi:hypothetical protein
MGPPPSNALTRRIVTISVTTVKTWFFPKGTATHGRITAMPMSQCVADFNDPLIRVSATQSNQY